MDKVLKMRKSIVAQSCVLKIMCTKWKEKNKCQLKKTAMKKRQNGYGLGDKKIYGNTIKINHIRHLRWKEKRRVNVKDNKVEKIERIRSWRGESQQQHHQVKLYKTFETERKKKCQCKRHQRKRQNG